MADRDLSDYVEVAERIHDFRREYPEGSLRGDWTMIQVGDQHLVAYRAAAYRYPDDKAPGIGCAWELVPGRTPFTKGSELQNAETSAWGRAIIAVGASDAKRGIASREEVRNRRAERTVAVQCPFCKDEYMDMHEHFSADLKGCGSKYRALPLSDRELLFLPRNADGSLSRSRTIDAQKAAAGVMTDPQQRAHNKLRRDGEPDPQNVIRLSTTPDDDPFYQPRPEPVRTKPAGWLLSERFAALGVHDRKERLDQCAEIVGRPISSSKELEPGEIAAILEALQRRELTPDAH